ncbi:MAG: hypothetical protein EPN93_17070 [Spirochaetes bacterium]|nr:MAG: hypothetical protein EPN93_17070 [Spirochaetota bacterium]
MCPSGLPVFSRAGRAFDEIPVGEYTIGLEPAEAERAAAAHAERIKKEFFLNATPAHPVRIERLGIARSHVSGADFEIFARETGYRTLAEVEGWAWTWERGWVKRAGLCWRAPFGTEADKNFLDRYSDFPALQLSWNDAVRYCEWRASREGMLIRLPREAEYEAWLRRSGVRSVVDAGGGEPGPARTVEEFLELLERASESREGYRPPGLVWEWTADWFDAYPGGVPGREFGATYKVLRGGSLMSDVAQRGREYRFRRCPTARSPFYGFRFAIRL